MLSLTNPGANYRLSPYAYDSTHFGLYLETPNYSDLQKFGPGYCFSDFTTPGTGFSLTFTAPIL